MEEPHGPELPALNLYGAPPDWSGGAALLGGFGAAILPAGYVRAEVSAGLLCAVGLETVQTSVTHLLITAPAKVTGPDVRTLKGLIGGDTREPEGPLPSAEERPPRV